MTFGKFYAIEEISKIQSDVINEGTPCLFFSFSLYYSYRVFEKPSKPHKKHLLVRALNHMKFFHRFDFEILG